MNKKTLIWIILGVIVLGGVIWYAAAKETTSGPSKLDDFAKCLDQKGAKFYGAFWCPHCQTQKKMFGSSEKYLPYIECSTPDGQGQTPICIQKKIESYPTWTFADNSELTGEIQLKTLAEKTGCTLPQ